MTQNHAPRHRHAALAAAILMTCLLGAPMHALAQQTPKIKLRLPAEDKRYVIPTLTGKPYDFPEKSSWINTDKPISLPNDLKGHVVILDFWTYCCINCIHVLPRLKELEEKYKDQPFVVIGVHSAKFETEKDAKNIEQAIARYRVHHPVVVDQDMRIWRSFGARGWPTFAFLDTKGRMVYRESGELSVDLLDAAVHAMLEEGKENGTLAKEKFKITAKDLGRPKDQLSFPGKIIADATGQRLFIADSTHDRILEMDMAGKVKRIIGSGKQGLKDGSITDAQFNGPQGMALDGELLYVADTDNHAVRKVDLKSGAVTTLAGNGKRGGDRFGGGAGPTQELASPWDLTLHEGKLYIAMAGTHQLWTYDIKAHKFAAWVGSGVESITDLPGLQAELSQPSGVIVHEGHLYFADSEVSAVRRVKLADAKVETLIGTGLFDFGYKDGAFKTAMLQHCLGVAVLDGNIVVADTYNDAIRLVNLKDKTISTLLGGPGKLDLDEPTGLTVVGGVVYIADTNNHRIVKFDARTGKAEPLTITMPPASAK